MPSPAYFIDESPDANNAQFGTPYRLDVPRYFMLPRSAIGLRSNKVLRVVDGKYSCVSASTYGDRVMAPNERYFAQQRVQRDSDASLRRVKYANDGSVLRTPAPLLPFVPLARQTPSIRSTALNPATTDSDDEAEGETLSENLFRRAKQFNEHLRKQPHDIEQWLAFAAFQEQFVAAHGRPAPGAADDKRIAVLQVTLVVRSFDLVNFRMTVDAVVSRSHSKQSRLRCVKTATMNDCCSHICRYDIARRIRFRCSKTQSYRVVLCVVVHAQACQRRWDVAALEELWQKFLTQFPDSAHVWLSCVLSSFLFAIVFVFLVRFILRSLSLLVP